MENAPLLREFQRSLAPSLPLPKAKPGRQHPTVAKSKRSNAEQTVAKVNKFLFWATKGRGLRARDRAYPRTPCWLRAECTSSSSHRSVGVVSVYSILMDDDKFYAWYGFLFSQCTRKSAFCGAPQKHYGATARFAVHHKSSRFAVHHKSRLH